MHDSHIADAFTRRAENVPGVRLKRCSLKTERPCFEASRPSGVPGSLAAVGMMPWILSVSAFLFRRGSSCPGRPTSRSTRRPRGLSQSEGLGTSANAVR